MAWVRKQYWCPVCDKPWTGLMREHCAAREVRVTLERCPRCTFEHRPVDPDRLEALRKGARCRA